MADVDPGVREGTRTSVTTWSNSLGESGSYTGNIVGEHSTSKGSSSRSNGWRQVTPYRVFASRMELSEMDFFSEIHVRYLGTTDHRNGISFIPTGLQYFGTVPAFGLRYPDVPNGLRREVEVRAMKSLGDQKANLSADVAELGQTIDYLAELAVRLYRLLKAVRKLDVKGALAAVSGAEVRTVTQGIRYRAYKTLYSSRISNAQRLNRLNNGRFTHHGGWTEFKTTTSTTWSSPGQLWLELQYAILPFLGEISGVMNFLAEPAKKPLLINGKGSSSVSQGTPVGLTYTTSGKSIAGAECKVWAIIEDSSLRQAARLGVSLPGMLGGIWEVVPYSFVVDWILPIGSILESLAARVGLRFYDGYVGLRRNNEFVATRNSYLSTKFASAKPPSIRYKSVCYQRIKLGSFPVPGLYAKSPFSSPHVINAIALLTSSGSRRF